VSPRRFTSFHHIQAALLLHRDEGGVGLDALESLEPGLSIKRNFPFKHGKTIRISPATVKARA
jgi:hypothetical protein